jgi:hypothetical protein
MHRNNTISSMEEFTTFSFSTASPILEMSLYPYPSQIVNPKKATAPAFARQISALGHVSRPLVIWCDGSAEPFTTLPCAGAISYMHPKGKRCKKCVG